MKKRIFESSLLMAAVVAATAHAVPPGTGIHNGRDIRFDSNNVSASIGGEFGFVGFLDYAKEAGGREAKIEPYLLLEGDVTHRLSETDVLGVGFELIEPDSALVNLEDERSNRVQAPGLLYGPQWRELRFYWRHEVRLGNELWEIDLGRDQFLGYSPLLGGREHYQGSLPVLIRQTGYWDGGASFRFSRFSASGRQICDARLALLNSEGLVGMEDGWFANSYAKFGAQLEIGTLSLFGVPQSWGELSLLGSWTDSEGGSSAGKGNDGAKENFSHEILGLQYSREILGLDFQTRFLNGSITRGKNDVDRHEKTSAWTWETLVSGFELGESEMDLYFSLSEAQKESGEPYWVWKGPASYHHQWMVGGEIRNLFGVSEQLSVSLAYFRNNFQEEAWKALGSDGAWLHLKYRF
jgi:hypothetical protein